MCFQEKKKKHAHILDHPVCAYEDSCEEQTIVYVGVVFRCQRCLCLWGGGGGGERGWSGVGGRTIDK